VITVNGMTLVRRAASLTMCSLALVACTDPDPSLQTFRFTAPGPAIELVPVPGESLAIAWTAEHDGALDVDLELRPTNPPGDPIGLGLASIDDGAFTWPLPADAPRAGLYQLVAGVRDGERLLDETTSPSIILVQGAEFRDTALTFTGAQTDRDIWIRATLASIIEVEVFLADTSTSPRHVLARFSVASDLAPIGRVIVFNGTTLDGDPIPAGTHHAFIEILARDGTATYLRDGLTVTWTP
jgi:hypothetical protein